MIESGVISPVDAARCLLSASASFFKNTINALTFSFSSTCSLISFADSGKLLHCYCYPNEHEHLQGENIVINKMQTNIELTSPLLGIRSENDQLHSGIPPLTIQIDEGIPADAGIHSRHEAFPHFDVEHATRFAGRVDRDDPGLYILLYSAGFWSETTPVAVLAAVEEGKIYLVTYPAPRSGGGRHRRRQEKHLRGQA